MGFLVISLNDLIRSHIKEDYEVHWWRNTIQDSYSIDLRNHSIGYNQRIDISGELLAHGDPLKILQHLQMQTNAFHIKTVHEVNFARMADEMLYNTFKPGEII